MGVLRFSGAAMTQMLASLEMLEVRKNHTVTMMMGTNVVSRGESRKMTMMPEKESCFLQELRIYLDPTKFAIQFDAGCEWGEHEQEGASYQWSNTRDPKEQYSAVEIHYRVDAPLMPSNLIDL